MIARYSNWKKVAHTYQAKWIVCLMACGYVWGAIGVESCRSQEIDASADRPDSVRFATFNISFHDSKAGGLVKKLAGGQWAQARQIAEVIQMVRPDVLLLNEFDYQPDQAGVELFLKEYLAVGQNGHRPIDYPYQYSAEVNTGIDSGYDLNEDRRTGTASDALGFGRHPGQYGMVVLSNRQFDRQGIRTFQKFLWKDMPGARLPIDPASEQSYYRPQVLEIFRLSSKSHWDVPIPLGDQVVHFLVSHPTPPVFDGPEDRNGLRNHDEIRLWSDYIQDKADYLYDDRGNKGGLPAGSAFIVAGDLNADPLDGDSHDQAIGQLLENPLVQSEFVPESTAGDYWAKQQGGANGQHQGNPLQDTGDFPDETVGNIRADYLLPSRNLKVMDGGVVWPAPGEPGAEAVKATDHRMVWIDIQK
ncbi:MAG: endonuclease/exonuclease/phosphatase family protein [Planctomycetota bacterium]|nr:endonuclease/exonuclease/phosphatase family protein [Planctomycetota bacterium]